MTKKKILFYTDCPIFGGCEKPIFEVLASEELSSGYDFTVIFRSTKAYLEGLALFWPSFPKRLFCGIKLFDINTVSYYLTEKIKNPLLLRIAGKSVTLISVLMTPFIFSYDFLLLSSIFRRNRADMIHINNGGYPGALSCRAAAAAARAAGFKKIILSVHNTAFKSRGIIDAFIDGLVKRDVDVVVTGSRASGSALAKNRGFDPKKIITIYHGVRPAKISPGKPPVEKEAGFGKYISMVARFEDRKGHRYAVEAFKGVINGNPAYADIKLVLIGDGPVLADIKQLVASERLDNNVLFMGHRDDYIDYVASSLFLINPSIGYEDLPYIILEAMSLGVPVIGTDIAGIPEEIENGITGIIVPPKDAGAIKTAMVSLLSDHNMRVKMGKASRERFDKLFTLDKMINRYLALYDSMGQSPGAINQ